MKPFSAAVACLATFIAFGCNRSAPAAEHDEAPTIVVTNWTDTSELFMEHPPFVAGQTIRFAVHLTRLTDFAAVKAGRPRIAFTPGGGGRAIVLPGTEALRPGAFRVEGTLPAAGKYSWALIIEGADVSDTHDLGTATVFADEDAAFADAENRQADDAAAIPYLKEQQWTNPFAAVIVQEGEVRRSIRVPAVIEPLTGGEAIVSAPADGRFGTSQLPAVGDEVVAGQVLGRFEPRLSENTDDHATLVANVAAAQADVEAARLDLDRAQKLLAERAVPARRVTDAQRATTVAEARLTAAQSRLAQRDETLRSGGSAGGNTFVLRAPIAGRVAEVHAARGAAYDGGAPLFRIVRTDRVELQAHIPASDAPLRQPVHQIAIEVPGRSDPLVVTADHMHDAGVIDPKTRALPVQFHVDNRSGQLLIGQTATAILYSGDKERMLVVPKTAILTEGGRPFVFVQTGGESFARRFIDIAARDGDVIGVRSGVRRGERVVTLGAYEVQLASAAGGLPAEGHVH